MIACRHGNHAAFGFIRAQAFERIQRAAFFKRGRKLQILEFYVNVSARDFGQGARMQAGRFNHFALNGICRCADFIKRDHA